MASSDSFLRQLSSKEGWKSTSRRWVGGGGGWGSSLKQMEGCYGGEMGFFVMKKRVMVLVDQSSYSKHAMMWALTHVANKGDILTLLHIVPSSDSDKSSSHFLVTTMGSLCKACKPEVEVEALVIKGPKLGTVMSQVKKLEVSVLILGQKRPSSLLYWSVVHYFEMRYANLTLVLMVLCLCLKSSTEEFVEQCINTLECLTIGVRKQSGGVGGYLISTRWHKNFWLLA